MTLPPTNTLRVAARCALLTPAVALLVGCSTSKYQGAEPFARTFHEDANARNYYVGMDLSFSLDQDSPHVPPAQRYDPDVR